MTGGRRLDDPDRDDPRLAQGYFYAPTVFDHCDRSMRIVQDETFGPILTVERFTTEAQALELANDTRYGLAGGVRTADAARAERFARGMRHGTVWINDFGYYTPAAEWGGYGRSGNGRELGPSGSPNTRRPNTSGTTPRHRRQDGSRHDTDAPDTGMEHFGYKESLDRSIGKFASFAAGVSYISILTGTFQLFYFGFGTAGAANLWSWPIVFVGQLAVALCFMSWPRSTRLPDRSTTGRRSSGTRSSGGSRAG